MNEPNKDIAHEILHLAGKKIAAKGLIQGEKFIVLTGSGFCLTEMKSCPKYIKAMRQSLNAEGKIKNGIFTEDVPFNSPSSAAACILGGSANGNVMWLYSDGETIKAKAGASYPVGTIYYLERAVKNVGTVKAIGCQRPDGFAVLHGSSISPIDDNTIPERVKIQRKNASLDENRVLLKDEVFSSSSYAAMFVVGKSANGLTSWKDENGHTLKSLKSKEKDN